MKDNSRLFLWGTVFYAIAALIYGVWTVWFYGEIEWIGTVALTFTALMAFIVGFYMAFTAKRLGFQPEDEPDADPEDADPDYGFYSPHSWWPLVLAGGVAIIAFGWVFAIWIMALGVGTVLFGLWGLLFEYYRGNHAH
jgi:hypothetical protein